MASTNEIQIVDETMRRYHVLRDRGHTTFVEKADECDGLFTGEGHWDKADREALSQARKPVLTINAIIQTMAYILGNQIQNATDVTMHPRRRGATDETATILGKVFRQITTNNKWAHMRSEMFADGMITSRGFVDVRMDYSDSLLGEVRYSLLDPRQVLIDPDANTYEPDGWSDVVSVQYMTLDMIEVLWGKKKAAAVRVGRHGYDGESEDSILSKQNFANASDTRHRDLDYEGSTITGISRMMVIERQYRKLDRHDHYIWVRTGDMRPVPSDHTESRQAEFLAENPDVVVMPRIGRRVRWTVVCNGVLLHDDWSPYSQFTIFPYFPYFRRGHTVGIVENLRDPQKLLNKTTSQELNILNSTANGGWKVRRDNLSNMSIGELENRGGETGLVIEVEEMDGLEKLQPNQIPSGLDRIAYKADEYIKAISGVSDYMRGSAREDVSAKSVQANQNSGAVAMVKPLSNLQHTDELIARHVLDMVQSYYTDERILRVVTDTRRGTTEDVAINQITESGVLNDLTVGEYDIILVDTPLREMDEDTEFEQLTRMRVEMGIAIPDEFIIRASRLKDRAQLLEFMTQQAQNEAQNQANAMAAEQQAADIDKSRADAELARAKAQQAIRPEQAVPEKDEALALEVDLMKFKAELDLKTKQMMAELDFKERELQLKTQEAAQKREDALLQARMKASADAQKPTKPSR